MGSRHVIGFAAILLSIAAVVASSSSASAARKPHKTSMAPTRMFVSQAQVHIFTPTAPVTKTFSSYKSFANGVCGKTGFTKTGWRAGAVERMKSFNTENQLSICGSTYKSNSVAHQAYILALSNMKTGFTSETSRGTNIGFESARAYGMDKALHLPVNEIIFRSNNTLVRVKVLGRKALTVHLRNLAETVNKNLTGK